MNLVHIEIDHAFYSISREGNEIGRIYNLIKDVLIHVPHNLNARMIFQTPIPMTTIGTFQFIDSWGKTPQLGDEM